MPHRLREAMVVDGLLLKDPGLNEGGGSQGGGGGGTCSVLGGGSEARSARLMEAPLRMWSRKWMSTSLKKSCRVGTWEGAVRMGVRARWCIPRRGPVVAGEGVTATLAAERVVTAAKSSGKHKYLRNCKRRAGWMAEFANRTAIPTLP